MKLWILDSCVPPTAHSLADFQMVETIIDRNNYLHYSLGFRTVFLREYTPLGFRVSGFGVFAPV